jgi:hypothetical protein
MILASGPPITRDGARDEARRELAKSIYDDSEPDWVTQVFEWINRQVIRLWNWLNPDTSGGIGGFTGLGALAIVLVLVALVVVARLWLGPVRRSARRPHDEVDLHSTSSSSQLREEAEAFAGRGAYAEAVRSRLRAVVRMLEERGVLDPRPGRTAQEIAAEVGGLAPAAADALDAAVSVFGEIWYGGRAASEDSYATVVHADLALSKLRRRALSDDDPSELAVPA